MRRLKLGRHVPDGVVTTQVVIDLAFRNAALSEKLNKTDHIMVENKQLTKQIVNQSASIVALNAQNADLTCQIVELKKLLGQKMSNDSAGSDSSSESDSDDSSDGSDSD
jgi:hypothetical protein